MNKNMNYEYLWNFFCDFRIFMLWKVKTDERSLFIPRNSFKNEIMYDNPFIARTVMKSTKSVLSYSVVYTNGRCWPTFDADWFISAIFCLTGPRRR
jgi:hypothetical protein